MIGDGRLTGDGGFKRYAPEPGVMQCHYCEQEADVAVEKGSLKVGLCTTHLRERLEALADDDALSGLEDELDVERSGE